MTSSVNSVFLADAPREREVKKDTYEAAVSDFKNFLGSIEFGSYSLTSSKYRLLEPPPTPLAPSVRLDCAAPLLIGYVQQRRVLRAPVERLGFSNSRRGFGRVVSKRQHDRAAESGHLVYLIPNQHREEFTDTR